MYHLRLPFLTTIIATAVHTLNPGCKARYSFFIIITFLLFVAKYIDYYYGWLDTPFGDSTLAAVTCLFVIPTMMFISFKVVRTALQLKKGRCDAFNLIWLLLTYVLFCFYHNFWPYILAKSFPLAGTISFLLPIATLIFLYSENKKGRPRFSFIISIVSLAWEILMMALSIGKVYTYSQWDGIGYKILAYFGFIKSDRAIDGAFPYGFMKENFLAAMSECADLFLLLTILFLILAWTKGEIQAIENGNTRKMPASITYIIIAIGIRARCCLP